MKKGVGMAQLSKSEAAKWLGMSRTTLHKYIKKGRINTTPDGKIDTTELLRRGYTLHSVNSADEHGPVYGEQLWTGGNTAQTSVHAVVQQVDILQQQLADLKQELQDAKARELRLLSLLESQQRFLEAAKPEPWWPKIKAFLQGIRTNAKT
jgi:polyhydroxyalkanoate synthesis regulator phasin